MIDIINPKYSSLLTQATGVTVLSAAAQFQPYEIPKIIGLTILTGVGYGIANDMIACRDCIEYFTVGHFYDGQNLENRLVKTLNPNINAIAWGMVATWFATAPAGVALALISRIPFYGLSSKITAKQLAPYLAIGAAIALITAHIRARVAQKAVNSSDGKIPEDMRDVYSMFYNIPKNFKAGWHACNTRNGTGYLAIGVGGVILAIGVIAARMGLFNPTFNLFSKR